MAIASDAPVIPHPNELAKVVQEIEFLDAMCTELASSLERSTEVPAIAALDRAAETCPSPNSPTR